MPPVHFCICIYNTVRDTAKRFSDIVKDYEGCLSPYKVLSHLYRKISTWWRGTRKYILGNQRKVVCPILNLPIKSSRHFQWLLSYFMGTWAEYAVGMVSWCHSSPEVQYGWRLRKWAEMYCLKICLRNVRHPSRTRRFWYHTRVLFIVLAWVCRCLVMDRHTIIQGRA